VDHGAALVTSAAFRSPPPVGREGAFLVRTGRRRRSGCARRGRCVGGVALQVATPIIFTRSRSRDLAQFGALDVATLLTARSR